MVNLGDFDTIVTTVLKFSLESRYIIDGHGVSRNFNETFTRFRIHLQFLTKDKRSTDQRIGSFLDSDKSLHGEQLHIVGSTFRTKSMKEYERIRFKGY